MLVVIPSILEFGIWDSSNNPNIGTDSELRARLSVHLLLKLFKTVETFNGWNGGEGREPLYYTMGSPSPMPRPSIHSSGIKLSCDRQLLSAAHKNVQVGAILAGAFYWQLWNLPFGCTLNKTFCVFTVLKVVLYLGSPSDADGGGLQEENSVDLEIAGDPSKLDSISLQDFAKYTLQQLCR